MPSKPKKGPYGIQVFVQNVFLPHYIDIFPCATNNLQTEISMCCQKNV